MHAVVLRRCRRCYARRGNRSPSAADAQYSAGGPFGRAQPCSSSPAPTSGGVALGHGDHGAEVDQRRRITRSDACEPHAPVLSGNDASVPPARVCQEFCVSGVGCGPGRIMSAADLDRPAVPAGEAAGEAAMNEWAGLLVAQARVDGVGADRRRRAVDRAGAAGAPGPASRSRRPSIWAVSVTLRRAEGRRARATGRPPSGSPPRSARSIFGCAVTVRACSSRPRRPSTAAAG